MNVPAKLKAMLAKIKTYNPNADFKKIIAAYNMCIEHHGKQMRKSGEPYYTHPIAVADSIIDMGLDDATIITALLHDIVEDTSVTLDDLRELFSNEVADLVDGVTKLDKIKFLPDNAKQASNFRKLFLALSRDIRVLVVKLCDRLHNMQTIEYQSSRVKIRQITIETLEVFAPLAEIIGMYGIKDELQDLSFAALNSRAYGSIVKQLKQLKNRFYRNNNNVDPIKQFTEEISTIIRNNNIQVNVLGREKRPYSIWKKMTSKNIGFDRLSDIMAFRIITKNTDDCYRALGLIHQSYHSMPSGFMDYISNPKINGYRSLHTVILGPMGQKLEVQIRTEEMNVDAEYGLAAHWSYKHSTTVTDEVNGLALWIKKVMAILQDTKNEEEFFEATKLELYHEQIFAFTPKGEMVTLPMGATVIDFAFAVHEELGLFCDGAKIDGVMVDIDHKIINGDQVKVIKSKTAWPKLDWLKMSISGRAKAAIKKATKKEEQEAIKMHGINMVNRFLSRYNKKLDDVVDRLLKKHFERKNLDQVFIDIANNVIDVTLLFKKIMPKIFFAEESGFASAPQIAPRQLNVDNASCSHALSATAFNGIDSRLLCYAAHCCAPQKGSNIIGMVNVGYGIAIHSSDCAAANRKSIPSGCIINLSWKS
jgi:guanosine-3',5'-bis(diphosphate) 3'-pyrophosphohydrolase